MSELIGFVQHYHTFISRMGQSSCSLIQWPYLWRGHPILLWKLWWLMMTWENHKRHAFLWRHMTSGIFFSEIGIVTWWIKSNGLKNPIELYMWKEQLLMRNGRIIHIWHIILWIHTVIQWSNGNCSKRVFTETVLWTSSWTISELDDLGWDNYLYMRVNPWAPNGSTKEHPWLPAFF